MMQQHNLLKEKNYKINNKVSVHIPTVNEIFEFGEQKYYSIAQSLISRPYDMCAELDEIGIDYRSITEFKLFSLLLLSFAERENDTSILLPNLDLKNFTETVNNQNGENILLDKKSDIVIDRMIALEICNAIRKIHFWEALFTKAGNEEAARYRIERSRLKRKRLAQKPYNSFLESMVIALVNTEEFPYNYETIMDLSIYKLNASWRQIQKKKRWEQTMNGIYFGTVDQDKIDFEKISWLSPD